MENNIISFTKVKLPYGWLGNMAPYFVIYEEKEYRTTEALFQALRFTNHPEIQEKIRAEKSPMSAKIVAKEYKSIIEKEGYELLGYKDIENMKLCLRLKIEQHPELKQMLLDTGDSHIIEDCTTRPQGSGLFWGAALQNNEWVGENILGRIFMAARKSLKNNPKFNNPL